MATEEDKVSAPRVSATVATITYQHWPTAIRKTRFVPENKELMLAVLKDAVMTYKKYLYSRNARFKEPEALAVRARPRSAFFF